MKKVLSFLLVLCMLLPMVPMQKASATSTSDISTQIMDTYDAVCAEAEEKGYLGECTFYPSHCLFQVSSATTYVKSLPCSEGTNSSSTNVEVAAEGDYYTSIGLYSNTAGNLWYKVKASNGDIGYIYSGDTSFIAVESDITISGVVAPTQIKKGNAFSIKGTISSEYSQLYEVAAFVADDHLIVTIGTDSVDTKSYSLYNSTVDLGVKFDELEVGTYDYFVLASSRSYYAKTATEYATKNNNDVFLYECTFSVVEKTTCSHSYSSVVTTPTCTTNGYTTYTCKTCGYSYTGNTTAATGHSYGAWVTTTAATCTASGTKKSTCTACGTQKTETIPATGHKYSSKSTATTCAEYGKIVYTCASCGHSYQESNVTMSDWSTTKPSGIEESRIESRTEYRYKTKSTTTSSSSTKSGWTLYNTTTQWSDYGSWSGWSGTAVTASDTTKVETRTAYGYYYFLCSNCGAHMHGYGTCYTWAGGCGAATDVGDWKEVWSGISWDNAGLQDWYETGKYYTTIDGEIVFKWNSGGTKTQYRCCTRKLEDVYHFYKWSDWSNWSTTKATASDTKTVETRTVYRYIKDELADHKYTSVVTPPTATKQGYTTHTCSVCGDSYVDSYTTAVKINTQPRSVTVAEGETAKVAVQAVGDGLTYRWYYKNPGDSGYTYTSSFKGNTYSVVMNEARNGRQVLCRVYDKYGNVVQTNTVKLSMAKTTVKITQQPVSVTVAEGETAKVTVKAQGDGLTYRWYYKDVGMNSYTYTSSYKSNTYSVPMTAARNGRQVLCRVYDQYGNVVQTNTVKLSMKNTVKITQQPVSVTVAEGQTARVTVKATGDGLTYRWYFKDAGASSYSYTSSYKGNTYSVPMTDARNGRQVLCRVYDKYGNVVQTNTVILRMS